VKQVDHGAAHAFPPSPKNADNSSHWLLISTRSSSSKYGLLLLTAGMSDICTAHEGQYTSSVPQVRIHNPPHLSQYFSSKRTISKPSISMIASVAITLVVFSSNEKALCRLLGHRARLSYGEPVAFI
jgi:hypothetical protein